MSEVDASLPTIQMLWVEGRLTRLERLSMASFVACGHSVDLYTYGLENDPPHGVTVREAADIVPASRRFRHRGAMGYGSWATFSDFFRLALLYERGGIWCDADVVALKPLLFSRDMPIFAASEPARGSVPDSANAAAKITSCTMGSPARHRLIETCLKKFEQIDLANMRWADTGPGIVDAAIQELGLTQHVLHPEIICSIPHWEAASLLFGVRMLSPNAYAIHFWNEVLRWNIFDKNAQYDRHSVIERLTAHYLLGDAHA